MVFFSCKYGFIKILVYLSKRTPYTMNLGVPRTVVNFVRAKSMNKSILTKYSISDKKTRFDNFFFTLFFISLQN